MHCDLCNYGKLLFFKIWSKSTKFFRLSYYNYFLVSCSDDKTLRIWQCYEPGNQEGML